jgi:hypothetical protein
MTIKEPIRRAVGKILIEGLCALILIGVFLTIWNH